MKGSPGLGEGAGPGVDGRAGGPMPSAGLRCAGRAHGPITRGLVERRAAATGLREPSA